MKVLMVVSWYSPKDAETMFTGVFHYEQAMALKSLCDTALYYPYDTALDVPFTKGVERGLMTYRRKMATQRIPLLTSLAERLQIISDLRRICKEFQPDVLHAHCAFNAGNIVAIFGKLYGYPVVITEHSPMEQMRLEIPRVKSKMHYAYANSDANICVSSHSMKGLQEQFPDCKYQVIYNGIMSPENLDMDGQQYAREGKINCCIVAGFYSIDIKGYQYLLPAIAQLKAEGMPIVLHICGGGEYFDHFVNMARELGIEEDCIFYGNCPKAKVYSIVSQMDFNISASLYECSGVSVEEALLLKKPMLVTTSGGANSLVTEENAIVVEKGSTQALVDGIRGMVRRLPEFDAEKIYRYAFTNFEIGQVSHQHYQLYQSIVHKK